METKAKYNPSSRTYSLTGSKTWWVINRIKITVSSILVEFKFHSNIKASGQDLRINNKYFLIEEQYKID